MIDLDSHLAAIVEGDADAFGAWMSGAEAPLRDSLRSFAAAVDTEAVLQEALLRLWQVAPRFRPDGRPNGLLRLGFRVCRNLAISETRRFRARAFDPTQIEETRATVDPRPPDPLLRSVIQGCREQLPAQPARAIAERIASAGGEPDATLAQRLGMRKNTFLQNVSRARKLLAECLRRHGVDLRAEGLA